MKIINIRWETDEHDIDLPEEIDIPNNVEKDDIANYLSDKVGWLVNSFDIIN